MKTLTLDHIIGSLISHEERLAPLSNIGSVEENAFTSKEGDTSTNCQGEIRVEEDVDLLEEEEEEGELASKVEVEGIIREVEKETSTQR